MTSYPNVLSEAETLRAVVFERRSIARYGDGELKMANHCASIKSQVGHPELSARLRHILTESGNCLVGIPNIHSQTPKLEFWAKYTRYAALLADRPYVSSFITRPDSAPWINTDIFWESFELLWKGQDVTLVRGSGKSFTSDLLMAWGARSVTEILAPRQHAWGEYKSLMKRIGTPERAILCLGPTATVMAVDLCAKGVHAIDAGHVGLFMKKRARGDLMVVTEDDKAVDKAQVPA